jgi:hypothetical protein
MRNADGWYKEDELLEKWNRRSDSAPPMVNGEFTKRKGVAQTA